MFLAAKKIRLFWKKRKKRKKWNQELSVEFLRPARRLITLVWIIAWDFEFRICHIGGQYRQSVVIADSLTMLFFLSEQCGAGYQAPLKFIVKRELVVKAHQFGAVR